MVGRSDYSAEDMKRADWIWQGLIVLEVIVLAVGLAFGIDMGKDRVRIGDLVQAVLGNGDVTSESWLWVGRAALVALVVTVAYYAAKVKPKTIG